MCAYFFLSVSSIHTYFLLQCVYNNMLICVFWKGAWLQTRAASGSNESRHAVRTVERTDHCRLVGTVGWYAGVVRGSVSSQCQVRRHHECTQRHGDTAGDWYQQPATSAQVETSHPGDGVAHLTVSTQDVTNNTRIRWHEPRVDRKLLAATTRTSTVPHNLHGVSGRRQNAWPSHQEGPQRTTQDGW